VPRAVVTRSTCARPRPAWRRSGIRRWTRRDDAGAAAAALTRLPSLPRAELARIAARLIDRLEELDGDRDDWEDGHDREIDRE
jgi:hypothetical protein